MPNFAFQGRNEQGKLTSGVVEAVSADFAAGQLTARGLIPLSIEEVQEAKTSFDLGAFIGLNKISLEELII